LESRLPLIAALLLVAPAALADDKLACIAASDRAQVLRDSGKLVAAREALLACSRATCPTAVADDCSSWLKDVEARTPTVVVRARDAAGGDLLDVTVTIDGAPFLATLDGRARPLDPGKHTFRFERTGHSTVERSVLVTEGEKNRLVEVVLPAIEKPKPEAPKVLHTTSLVPTLAVGAVGLLGIAGFAYFGLSAERDHRRLQDCRPFCAESDVDAARTKAIVADVSLGVGVLGLAGAAVLFFTRRTPSTGEHVAIDVAPTASGAFATFRATF
jgi:hypothetical protein